MLPTWVTIASPLVGALAVAIGLWQTRQARRERDHDDHAQQHRSVEDRILQLEITINMMRKDT